jgi:hypothetical protein
MKLRNAVHDPSKAGNFARERFSSALMSDTKWRKLFAAVTRPEVGMKQMLMKFIDVEVPRLMKCPPSFECPHAYMDTMEFGPVELRAIEWLEFPRTAKFQRPHNVPPRMEEQNIDKAAEAIAALGMYPLELTADAVRITGYRR